MPPPVTLRGSAVVLVPLAGGHVAGLLAAAAEDRSSYALTSVPTDRASAERYVAAALAEQAAGTGLPFAVLEPAGRVVGSTRFLDLETWDGAATPTVGEIGSTWYAASVQRTAVNTEAKLLLLTLAFDDWRVLRVTFKTDERNARSRTAIERLGARFEGVRRVHLPAADGGVRHSAYYSIVREEWPAVRDGLRHRLRRG